MERIMKPIDFLIQKKYSSNMLTAIHKYLSILIGFIAFSLSTNSYAGIIELTQRKYLFTMNTATLSTMSAQVTDPNTFPSTTFVDKSSVGYLQLGINPDTRWCYDTAYREITVTFNVTYKRLVSGTLTTFTDPKTLVISFDAVNRQVYTEKARVVYDNFVYDMKADVGTVVMKDRAGTTVYSGTGFSALPQDLYWEVGLQAERYMNINYTSVPTGFAITNDITTNEIKFSWASMVGAEFYEIEFQHVNDYSSAGLSTPKAIGTITTTFKNNATRIRVPAKAPYEYRIPNVFERGYVVARIRAIGIGGPTLSNEIYCNWSWENTYTSGGFLLGSGVNYLLVNEHENGSGSGDNKNWKLSASYAEDGKHKEIVEYADGSSRVRQSVTNLSSTGEVVVGETAYDHQGRPTIQILPVPLNNNKVVKYYDNFNKELVSNSKLNRTHFDINSVFVGASCIPTPPQLSTSSGANFYYSTFNTNKNGAQGYVPLAENYPYTQVVYTPDNTGRIKTQSGVGKAHILGSGHETKYYYGKPLQPELDRLFGTNVGYASHYQKNMVVDANGQVSISFLDMSGKTIATALAGQPPASLLDVTDSEGQSILPAASETLNVNLLGDVTATYPNGENNFRSVDGLVWSNVTPLLVENTTTYDFSYSATIKDYLNSCLGEVCMDCVYDLEIDILDECNISKLGSPFKIKLGNADDTLALDTNCNQANSFVINSSTNSSFAQTLTVGNYTIIKKLKLNEDAINQYTEMYLQENNCIKERDDFFVMPDTSGCFYSCEECNVALGDLEEFYQENEGTGIDTAELRLIYYSKKATCDEMCDDGDNNMCLLNMKNMERDMTPGGQYAKYEEAGGVITTTDRLSIFHDDHLLPDHTSTIGTYQRNLDAWRHPHFFDKENPTSANYAQPANEYYFDANGQKSKIYIEQDAYGYYQPAISGSAVIKTDAGGEYIYPHELAHKKDFIDRFNNHWAKSLLVYHPEFKYLEKCLEVSNHSWTIGSGSGAVTFANMWEYEKYLQNFDISNTAELAKLFPTTGDLHAFDLSANDPFFINYNNVDLYPPLSISDIETVYVDKVNNYLSFSGCSSPQSILNIWEYANAVDNCTINDPNFSPCNTCPGGPGWDLTNKSSYITTPNHWDRLVGAYLAIKQDIFYKYLKYQLRFNNTPPLVNDCIGLSGYDVSTRPYTNSPWLPCDLQEYVQFEDKQARFGEPSTIYNNGPFDPAPPTAEQLLAYGEQQVYEQTGLCPAAMNLQTLIWGLKEGNDINTTFSAFNTYNYLMLNIKDKLSTQYGSVPTTYAGSISGQVLTAYMNNGTNLPGDPTFTLTLPSTPIIYSWSNVQSFANISNVTATSGGFNFQISALVITAGVSEWVTLAGFTNMDIGDCETELDKICAATQEAKDIKALLQTVKTNHYTAFTLGTQILSGPIYDSFVTPLIKSYIGTGGSYEYQFNGGNPRIVNTAPLLDKYIQINISSGGTDFFAPGVTLFSIAGNAGTSSSSSVTNLFTIGGYSNMADYYLGEAPDKTINGKMVYGTFTLLDTTNYPTSECSTPPPMECETFEHDRWFELKEHFINNTVASSCATILTGSLPTSYNLISLIPDLTYSNNGVSSTHFIAVVEPTSPTLALVTITGEYCEEIRACGDCTNDCDNASFLIDVVASDTSWYDNENVHLHFAVPPGMSTCYPELDTCVYDLGTPPMNYAGVQAKLLLWVSYINSLSPGDFYATYMGNNQVKITVTGLASNGCICNSSTLGNGSFFATDGYSGGDPLITASIASSCCAEDNLPPPPSTSGPWAASDPITIPENNCVPNLTPFPSFTPVTTNPCVEGLFAAANLNADNAYNNYLDSVKAAFRIAYINECMSATESFQVEFISMQYHFTLYYYDQAGNLVKTVPPAAVTPIPTSSLSLVTSNRNAGYPNVYVPNHDIMTMTSENLSTKYVYNTLNQPRYQLTPDGGRTQFIYDQLGRLAISQNAKQLANNNSNSYTIYDKLGRIIEVGEMNSSLLITQVNALVYNAVPAYLALTASTRTEITNTYYDIPVSGVSGVVQQELRNRVSYTTYKDVFGGSTRTAAYYTYDIHGNVKTVWQQNMDVPQTAHQIKRMDYTYDLVSGKVNTATYQQGGQDMWIHRYSYDADNRITAVETSRDNVFYDLDAKYLYYKHGPLARTELGNNKIQGIDYAYTIHGWLKGINSTNLDATFDMGYDADAVTGPLGSVGVNRYFARDAASFALHYYNDNGNLSDYKNIRNNTNFIGNIAAITSNANYKNLFNGNINAMQTTLYDSSFTRDPMLSLYRYDQLNRLRSANYTQAGALNLSNNTWANTFNNRYKNELIYDQNGNIMFQTRNGKAGLEAMDDLVYKYTAGTNQLENVDELQTITTNYLDDLENQNSGNYGYDLIGNLIRDDAEEIADIQWTVYGKIKSVTRVGGSPKDNLEFTYGPGGQRLTKKITKANGDIETSFYFYDASGNMMSIYTHSSQAESDLYLEEQMMYGSSRLGSVIVKEKLVAPPTSVIYMQKRGQKRYEINNHLGNVLTVVSDRKKYNCTAKNYDPDIINTWDYSPFGAILPGRHVSGKKCVTYAINTRLTLYSNNFAVNSSLTATASATVFYELNSSSVGEINGGVLKISGTGNPRGVVKQISVVSGKTYRISFKHFRNTCTGTGATYVYRIYNAATGGTLLASYAFSPTSAWQTIDNTNAFTATTTGTYRIEIVRSGNTTNCEFQVDDFIVTYQEDVNHSVCITQGDYRFGFNGQEKDNEVYGEGNSYNAEYWQYDSRLGRRWNVDPMAKKYPHQSPYAAFNNSPLYYIDPKGLEGGGPGDKLDFHGRDVEYKNNGNNQFKEDAFGRTSLPQDNSGVYSQSYTSVGYNSNPELEYFHTFLMGFDHLRIDKVMDVHKDVSWQYNEDKTEITITTKEIRTEMYLDHDLNDNQKSNRQAIITSTETYKVVKNTQLQLFQDDIDYMGYGDAVSISEPTIVVKTGGDVTMCDDLRNRIFKANEYNTKQWENLRDALKSSTFENGTQFWQDMQHYDSGPVGGSTW
jgi:hypothetical protein